MMNNLTLLGFLFTFFITLNVSKCVHNDTKLIHTYQSVKQLKEFDRKIAQFWEWAKGYFSNEDTFIGRCFGGIKKLRLVINFIIFKLGVIVTTLVFLSAMMFKALGIGVILLIINSVGFFSKFLHLKQDHHSSASGNIHLHIHNKGGHGDLHDHSRPPWYDRMDTFTPKNAAEKQAISDLYKKIGLSEHYDKYS
ncbi:hypothetical protein FQA39_LY09544 [Lamprigera yunnana]|nr:hypothetical protein FQA39_LY09544 [Lamprigera yunnana]